MGKLNSRLIGLILLVVWCSMVCADNSNSQYRRVFINEEDAGEIVYFLLYILISEYGKKLDKGYRCPVYCEVDHKHRIIEDDTKTRKSTDKKTSPGRDRPADIADRQQPESSI
jgi:hypothetical protein